MCSLWMPLKPAIKKLPGAEHIGKWLQTRAHRRKWRRADVLIISHPKAGRTWLRTLLAGVIVRHYEKQEFTAQLEEYAQDDPRIPSIYFTHEFATAPQRTFQACASRVPQTYALKKTVLLVRDPRDVVVSWYHHRAFREGKFQAGISAFIRHPQWGIQRQIEWLNLLLRNRRHFASHLLVQYEHLQADTASQLRKILAFCNIDGVTDATIDDAVRAASFPEMRKQEIQRKFQGLAPADLRVLKCRKGKVGGYAEELPPEDILYVNEQMRACEGLYQARDMDGCLAATLAEKPLADDASPHRNY